MTPPYAGTANGAVGGKWVRQADVDDGLEAGTTSVDRARLRELEQENRELRRANAISRSASVFFAAELDRPQR